MEGEEITMKFTIKVYRFMSKSQKSPLTDRLDPKSIKFGHFYTVCDYRGYILPGLFKPFKIEDNFFLCVGPMGGYISVGKTEFVKEISK